MEEGVTPPSRPLPPHEPDSIIVLRLPRAQKATYVRAAQACRPPLTLLAWATRHLDAAAQTQPPAEKKTRPPA